VALAGAAPIKATTFTGEHLQATVPSLLPLSSI